MSFKAVLFDLDGTLLHTLPGLVEATNTILERHNMPVHTTEKIQSFVGNGGKALLKLAAVENTTPELLEEMYEEWEQYLTEHASEHADCYDGIISLLDELKARGVCLAVVSNKPDAAAKAVIDEKLSGYFLAVHGSCEEYPRKPEPTSILKTIAELGFSPTDCAYIGDSANDVNAAKAAGVYSIAVTWGYGATEGLYDTTPDIFVNNANELLASL